MVNGFFDTVKQDNATVLVGELFTPVVVIGLNKDGNFIQTRASTIAARAEGDQVILVDELSNAVDWLTA